VAAKKKSSKKSARWSASQLEIVGQFSDYAFDNANLNFEEVARKELGPKAFPNTSNGRKFRAECKAVFDLEQT
jgi:hypothetical protein